MKEDAGKATYEQRIIGFHDALAHSRLSGFIGSSVSRIAAAPWLASKNLQEYEDWYLLDGSEVLDRLNETAVADSRKTPHDDIAALATDFKGGLYQLKLGAASLPGEHISWISKPRGTSYEEFYSDISNQFLPESSTLWRRFLTLGPTPEFCIISPEKIDLPPMYNAIVIQREVIWKSKGI